MYMVLGKVHFTKRFERHRIKSPSLFKKGSFRTHDIGMKGGSKRIAGVLKSSNKWATQAVLISRKEPRSMKVKLRKTIKYLQRKA